MKVPKQIETEVGDMAYVLHWKRQIAAESFFQVDHLARQIRPFMPPHSHDYAEIFFVEDGSGTHEINGELQSLTRGDLIMIRPFIDTHCIRDGDPNLSILHIAVRASSVRFLETRYFDSNPSFWGGAGRTPMILTLSLHQQGWIQAATRKLSAAPQRRLEIDRFLLDLTETLQDAPVTGGAQHLTDWLQRACAMIEDPQYFAQGSKGFTLLANRSKEHVARELKKCLGKTPTEIVNQARMRYAADKLCHSTIPIIDIAMDCGFESLSHFYKIFRIAYGITPRQYRQLSRTAVAVPDGN
jgi:AraC-like DNA-binding protein/mannose-6-phosphate isomerase-like protein (cupin superfamily)